MAKGRKLHEILKEQQEPFYLDMYLLEKGYSSRVLENQEKINFCWPINARNNLHRLTKDDFTRKRSGVFRGILSRILYWKLTKKTLKCEKTIKALDHGIMINGQRFSDLNSNSSSNCFEVESEMKKQSPVSVLEFHSYDASPVHSKEDSPKKALNIFKELLQLAYITPNPTNDFSNSNDLDDWSSNSDESSIDELLKESLIFPLERENSETLAFVGEMVISDFRESTKNWGNFKFEMNREIGMDIEDAIFEEIKEELVLGILGLPCK